MSAVCSTCRWFRAVTPIAGFDGRCHRYPPSVGATPRMTGTHLIVNNDDSCGEHTQRATVSGVFK